MDKIESIGQTEYDKYKKEFIEQKNNPVSINKSSGPKMQTIIDTKTINFFNDELDSYDSYSFNVKHFNKDDTYSLNVMNFKNNLNVLSKKNIENTKLRIKTNSNIIDPDNKKKIRNMKNVDTSEVYNLEKRLKSYYPINSDKFILKYFDKEQQEESEGMYYIFSEQNSKNNALLFKNKEILNNLLEDKSKFMFNIQKKKLPLSLYLYDIKNDEQILSSLKVEQNFELEELLNKNRKIARFKKYRNQMLESTAVALTGAAAAVAIVFMPLSAPIAYGAANLIVSGIYVYSNSFQNTRDTSNLGEPIKTLKGSESFTSKCIIKIIKDNKYFSDESIFNDYIESEIEKNVNEQVRLANLNLKNKLNSEKDYEIAVVEKRYKGLDQKTELINAIKNIYNNTSLNKNQHNLLEEYLFIKKKIEKSNFLDISSNSEESSSPKMSDAHKSAYEIKKADVAEDTWKLYSIFKKTHGFMQY